MAMLIDSAKAKFDENVSEISQRLLRDAQILVRSAQAMQAKDTEKGKTDAGQLYMQAASTIELVLRIDGSITAHRKNELSQDLIANYSKARMLLELSKKYESVAECHFKLAAIFEKLDDDRESARRHTELGLQALSKTAQRDRVSVLLGMEPERGRKKELTRQRYAIASAFR